MPASSESALPEFNSNLSPPSVSPEVLQRVLEQDPDLTWWMSFGYPDSPWRVSGRLSHWLGISGNDKLSQTDLLDACQPSLREEFGQWLSLFASSGSAPAICLPFHGPAGRVELQLTASQLPALNGNKLWGGTIRRLPESETMQRLVQLEATFKAFLDHIPMPAWIKDNQYRYVLVNKALESFFEADESNILGKTDFDFNSPEIAEEFRRHDRRVVEGGELVVARETARFKNGRVFHSLSYKFPIPGKEGDHATGGIGVNVNQLVAAEEALAAQKLELERQAALLQHGERVGQMGTWIMDPSASHLTFSGELLRLYELDPATTNGTNIFERTNDRIHPDDQPLLEAARKILQEKGRFEGLTFRVTLPGDRIRWFEMAMEQSSDGSAYGITRDITEFERNRQQLHALNEHLEEEVASRTADLSFFNTCLQELHRTSSQAYDSPQAAWDAYLALGRRLFCLSTGMVVEVSGWDYHVVALSSSKMKMGKGLTMDLRDTICNEVISCREAVGIPSLEKAGLTQHPAYLKLGMRSYLGTPVRMSGEIFGVLNFWDHEDHEATFFPVKQKIIDLMAQALGTAMELFASQRNFERSEAKFQALAENAPLGIKLGTPEGDLLYVNPAFARMLGYTIEELYATNLSEFTHPDDRESNRQHIQDLVLKGDHDLAQFEKRYIRKDGLIIRCQFSVSKLWMERSKEMLILSIIADITQDRAQKEEILNTNQELEQLLYTVSHDLRAPVRHISAYAHFLKEEAHTLLNTGQRSFLDNVLQASGRLGTQIDELLEFARHRKVAMNKEWLDTNQLVEEIISLFSSDTQARNIAWEVNPLPQIFADRAMMDKVFLNMLGNSVKFTNQTQHPRIAIFAEREPDWVHITVRDNGAGFDPKYKNKLFEIFQRLHKRTEFEGTGIGLANVHRILTRHGGSISGDSLPGQGATFTFSLPMPYYHG